MVASTRQMEVARGESGGGSEVGRDKIMVALFPNLIADSDRACFVLSFESRRNANILPS